MTETVKIQPYLCIIKIKRYNVEHLTFDVMGRIDNLADDLYLGVENMEWQDRFVTIDMQDWCEDADI